MPFVVGLVALALSTGLFALAQSLPVLIVARTLQGLSAAAVWIVGLSIIADNVPSERVGEAMGYTTVALSWGSLLGPAIGGIMYDKVGFYGAFIVPICLLVADVVMRFAMIETRSESTRFPVAADVPFLLAALHLLSTESAKVNDSPKPRSNLTSHLSKRCNETSSTFASRAESATESFPSLLPGDEQAPLLRSSTSEVETGQKSDKKPSATVFSLLRSPRLPRALAVIVMISIVISSLDAVSEL